MEAKELRIGNWLLNTNNEYEQVYDIGHDVNEWDISVLYPIPLTEEILLKCGFENSKFNSEWLVLDIDRYYFEINTIGLINLGVDENRNYVSSIDDIKCEYLHDLQNKVFALTGEELDIDLSR